MAGLLRYKVLIVLALAVMLRAGVLMAFPSVFAFDQTGAIHGSVSYDQYAQNLLATGVYGLTPGKADAMIPPLYSYVLAGAYGLFGRSALTVGALHIFLDLLSLLMLYEIGRRLFRDGAQTLWGQPRGEMIGALGALFYAGYPYLIFQNLTLIDTPLFMTLLHAFVLTMIVLRERARYDRLTLLTAVLGGVTLGVAMLVRPILPPLAILVALWFLMRLSFWQTVLRLLPVATVGVLCVMPWVLRNAAVFDAFVPMTTTSGSNLWQGNSAWTVPVFRAGYDVQWTSPEVSAPRHSREADAARFALVLAYWREHPEAIPELLWVKFLVHWSIDIAPRYNPREGEVFRLDENGAFYIERGGESIPGFVAHATYTEPLFEVVGRWLHRFYYGGLFGLALMGMVLTARQWREVSLLWFVQISMTAVYMLFHPSTRYRAPTDPMLFLFSAAALILLLLWWQNRRGKLVASEAYEGGLS